MTPVPPAGRPPRRPAPPPARPAPPGRVNDVWLAVGVAIAVLVAVAGLALIAMFIVFVVGFSQWGSNK